MKKLSTIVKKGFCSNYHHDFVANQQLQKTKMKFALSMFDFARIIFYLYIGLNVGLHLPQYILYRRKNFKNNPDYLLFQEADFKN